MTVTSLLDVGSGHGAWAAEWLRAGVTEVIAVDGDYVQNEQLVIDKSQFVAHDLTRPLDLKRKFDLVQSLEVAEHVAAEHAERIVAVEVGQFESWLRAQKVVPTIRALREHFAKVADAEVDKLLAAWRSGDIDSLSKTLSEEYERFPELYGPLTENRNRAWVPQLVDLLDDDDDYLVVVGALHLVGRNSVIDLLEQRGYEVVQQ